MTYIHFRRTRQAFCEHFRRSVSRYIRKASAAVGLGLCASFVVPSVLNVVGKSVIAFNGSRAATLTIFPRRGWVLLGFAAVAALSYYFIRLKRFAAKIWRSWQAGLVEPMPGFSFLFSLNAGLGLQTRWPYPLISVCVAMLLGLAALDFYFYQGRSSVRSRVPGDPIKRPRQDLLFRSQAVDTVLEMITRGNPVIAVVGDFGDGKSSVLNLIARQLGKNADNYLTISFNSWLPGSQEALTASFLKGIVEGLRKRYLLEGIEEKLQNYARMLAGLVPKAGAGLMNLFKQRSQTEQINTLITLTRSLQVRIVVLVDDVDRMHKEELNAFFKLVRGIPEFVQITYVCAFSKDAIVHQLASQPSDRPYYYRFIEKFFPLQIELSKIDFNILAAEFDKRFEALCKQYDLFLTQQGRDNFNQEFYPIWAKYGRRFLTNLRRLDLYFGNLKSLFASARKEINIIDAMVLELLREVAPDLVEVIYRHGYHFYQAAWRWETMIEISHREAKEAEERKAFLNALLDRIPSERKEIAVGLLTELFPVVQEHVAGRASLGLLAASQAEKQRKIYHPACFPCYFIHRAPLDKFSATEFDKFRMSINEEVESSAMESRFFGAFSGLSFEPKRLDFLNWLLSSVEEFGRAQLAAMVKAISRIELRFSPLEIGGEFTGARNFVLAAVKQQTKEQGSDLLMYVIDNASSDPFAADVFFYAANPDRHRLRPDWDIPIDELKRVFASRMRRKYLDGEESIFILDRYSALHVLYRWIICGDEARREEERYLDKEFTSTVNVGRFLLWAKAAADPFDEANFEAVDQLYSTAKMKKLVDGLESLSPLTKDESEAVTAFRSDKSKSAQPEPPLSQAPQTSDRPLYTSPVDWESIDLRVELNQANQGFLTVGIKSIAEEELRIRRMTLRSNRIDLSDPMSAPKGESWVISPNGLLNISVKMATGLKRELIIANGGDYRASETFNLEVCLLCQIRGSTKEIVKTIRVITDAHNDAVTQVR